MQQEQGMTLTAHCVASQTLEKDNQLQSAPTVMLRRARACKLIYDGKDQPVDGFHAILH